MSAIADVQPALIEHLKDLHLPTVRQCYEETARRAEQEMLIGFQASQTGLTCVYSSVRVCGWDGDASDGEQTPGLSDRPPLFHMCI